MTGSAGQVGSEVVAELERRAAAVVRGRGIEVVAADRRRLDVSDRDAVLAAVTSLEPDVVVHPAAWTAVDACEGDPDRAFAVNALGTRHVAEAARLAGAHVAYVSTDYVFDGTTDRAYTEWDEPRPRSVYGASKLGGERELDPTATVVRTSWVCGRSGANMVKTVLRLASSGDGPLRFVDDQHGCPTVAGDLASTLVDLALSRRPGLFHVTNAGEASWYELARHVVAVSGHDPGRVEPIATADLDPPRPAPRPARSVLDNAALRLGGMPLLPDWRESVGRLVAELTR
ncbi:MAG: dTDP-4-dehydrorhamnose reductase [Actinomycetota bacterium]|nr:dTDP-4-dehydrorhamnose reductase [Actinomycetota bacterium]